MKHFVVVFAIFFLLVEPGSGSGNGNGSRNRSQNRNWWQEAIFYQIWPASFRDTNADGIGDLAGIALQMPYFRKLGINGLWLTPIFQSPSYHGYDASDFLEIDRRYGSQQDFIHLLEAAHTNQIRIIVDLVINHVSNRHEWFRRAQKLEMPFSNYFVWKSEVDLEGSSWGKPWLSPTASTWRDVWHFDKARLEEHRRQFPAWEDRDRPVYYYAVFSPTQPDLNFDEPLLVDEILKIARYWLELGVDGFRLDGARYLHEEVQENLIIQADSKKTIEFWLGFGRFLKKVKPDAFLIGEIWHTNETISKYYPNGQQGLDAAFNFTFSNEIIFALTSNLIDEDKGGVYASLRRKHTLGDALVADFESKPGQIPSNFYSPFLSNHDQLRVSNQLGGKPGLLKSVASMLFTLPGTPFLYYGEEIGMDQPSVADPKDFYDDLFKRAPLFWNEGLNAGFGDGQLLWVDDAKWFPWRPNHQPWWNAFYEKTTVLRPDFSIARQLTDSASLLSHYRRLIALRKQRPELRASECASLSFLPGNGVVAAYRRVDGQDNESFVVINPTEAVKTIRLPEPGRYQDLISEQPIATQMDGSIEVGAFQSMILSKFRR